MELTPMSTVLIKNREHESGLDSNRLQVLIHYTWIRISSRKLGNLCLGENVSI